MAPLALAASAVVCIALAVKHGAALPLVLGGVEILAAGALWFVERLP
ncbi:MULTISPECIES: hypothetical protein [Methylorubrum]|nr:hypothetical protein [Methylorubrum suomiense]